jgi:hypothetical protein
MTFGATRWTRGEERMRRRRLQSRASHCRGAIRDPLHSYGLKVNRIVRVIRVHDTRHVSIFNECACATCLCACMLGCGARCVRLRVRGACMTGVSRGDRDAVPRAVRRGDAHGRWIRSQHARTNAAPGTTSILLYLAMGSVNCQNDTLGNLGRARHATDASREGTRGRR